MDHVVSASIPLLLPSKEIRLFDTASLYSIISGISVFGAYRRVYIGDTNSIVEYLFLTYSQYTYLTKLRSSQWRVTGFHLLMCCWEIGREMSKTSKCSCCELNVCGVLY
jgi:hypothetical protein